MKWCTRPENNIPLLKTMLIFHYHIEHFLYYDMLYCDSKGTSKKQHVCKDSRVVKSTLGFKVCWMIDYFLHHKFHKLINHHHHHLRSSSPISTPMLITTTFVSRNKDWYWNVSKRTWCVHHSVWTRVSHCLSVHVCLALCLSVPLYFMFICYVMLHFNIYQSIREDTKCNDALMELMIMAHACKIACARRIIGEYYMEEQNTKENCV